MLRLIACDMDGTLLVPETQAVPPETYDLIRGLNQEGILFAASSGRQLVNLRHLFAPVDNLVYYICENGALTAHGGEVTSITPIPDRWCCQIIRDMQSFHMDLLLSAPHYTYVLDENRAFADDMVYRLRNSAYVIHDTTEIMDPLIKISGHTSNSMAQAADYLTQKWQGKVNAVLAGNDWFDITMTNKGTGIKQLCGQLNIAMHDTAAFGDYYNDLAMLNLVGHPYIMENAPDGMKKPGFTVCRSVPETLEALLRQAKEGTL